MAACPKCSTRKARRECPALAQHICSVCCAELRMIELACPEHCQYLREARTTTLDRRTEKLVEHLMSRGLENMLETLKRFEPVILWIDRAVVQVQRYTFRNLSDHEVLEGLKNALKTYETLDRGIIYEHKAESPRIQAVTDAVLQALNEIKADLQQQGRSHLITTRDFLACLQFTVEYLQLEMTEGHSQAALRASALFHPYPKQESQIIITG